MELDLTSVEKAYASLEQALEIYERAATPEGSAEKEMLRDGVIQRFEYTFELCRKMLKRYLEMFAGEKTDAFTHRELFRAGVEAGMINSAEKWFEYLENRNLTSHTYDEEVAEKVFQAATDFAKDAKVFLEKLREKAH